MFNISQVRKVRTKNCLILVMQKNPENKGQAVGSQGLGGWLGTGGLCSRHLHSVRCSPAKRKEKKTVFRHATKSKEEILVRF